MKILGLIAAAALAVAPAAIAQNAPRAFIGFGEVADAPVGFMEMCARAPEACGLKAGEAAALSPRCAFTASLFPALTERQGCPGGDARNFVTAAIEPQPAQRGRETSQADGGTTRKLIKSINLRVNRQVLQRTDIALYGVDEYWRPAGSERGAMGDCEDIALEKRDQLIAAGFRQDQLLLAVVYKQRVGLHTVLLVRTDAGDMLLDSLSDKVRWWHQGGYSWLRVQQPGKPLQWARPIV